MSDIMENAVIVGSGPAGSTASLYLARANMSPIMITGFKEGHRGGQLTTTTTVENYPGFKDGIDGTKLVEDMITQAERFGTRVVNDDVTDLDLQSFPYKVFVGSKGRAIFTRSIIICSGAKANRLFIPGTHDGEFWQKGVSTCAVCDGSLPIFRDNSVAIIGGGDSAMEEATYMSKFASKVYIINRTGKFRASNILLSRIQKNSKIEIITNKVLKSVHGDKFVQSINIEDNISNEVQNVKVSGVFFAIGNTPNTRFLQGKIDLLPNGCIATSAESNFHTSAVGVFAAGDVIDSKYRQAVKAAGDGCAAALEAIRYIENIIG